MDRRSVESKYLGAGRVAWLAGATSLLAILLGSVTVTVSAQSGASGPEDPPPLQALPGRPADDLRSAQARVDPEVTVSPTGRVGGRLGPLRLDEDGRHAYLGMGNGVVVLDSSEAEARILARVDYDAQFIHDLVLAGDQLFVSLWPEGCCGRDVYAQMYRMDVSDPAHPRRLPVDAEGRERVLASHARFPLPLALDASAERLYFGGLTFALEGKGPLRFLGASQVVEDSRVWAGSQDWILTPAAGYGQLYTVRNPRQPGSEVLGYDMTDPASPILNVRIADRGAIHGLALVDVGLLIATDSGVDIFDPSQPSDVRHVATIPIPGGARQLFARGAGLIVLGEGGSSFGYDLLDPSALDPLWEDRFAPDVNALAARARDQGVDVIGGFGAIEIFAIAPARGIFRVLREDASPMEADPAPRHLRTVTRARRLALMGDRALVAMTGEPAPAGWGSETELHAAPELALVDIARSEAPRVVDHYELPGLLDLVALDGQAYLARGDQGLVAARFEGDRLRNSQELALPAESLAVDPEAGILYAGAATPSGLQLRAFDLADPAGLRERASRVVPALHDGICLTVAEGLLYLSTDRGLSIYELAGDRLRLVAHRDLPTDGRSPGRPAGIAAEGRQVWAPAGDRLHSLYRSEVHGLAYLAATEPLRTFPMRMSRATDVLLLGQGLGLVAEAGGASAAGRLHAIDLRDPWQPRRLATLGGMPGYTEDLARDSSQVWIADALAGIVSFSVEDLSRIVP